MEIPDILVQQIREGKAVIFLGAGASRGTTGPGAKKCPTTADLIDKLSTRFLGGKYKTSPLNQVAELAISETNLMEVQTFVGDLFADLQPSSAHLRLPRFDWYGLATTNYDLLVEEAFRAAGAKGQSLRPFIETTDRVDDNLKDSKNVLYIKLHGCITRINNPACPLILTTDQYIEHRGGRGRVFDIFRDWGYEHPVIFVGQSLQDSDLRAIIGYLSQEIGENRPRYYLVAPDADDTLSRFWETKKITVLKGGFEDFTATLDASIPEAFRHLALAVTAKREHEIERKFRVKTVLSRSTLQFLNDDVDYINTLNSTSHLNPADFYKGYSSGFGAIEQNLDVRRKPVDEILTDYVLEDPEKLQEELEFVLLKAHAGAGKSVTLKRIAWDTGKDFDRIALFLRPQGVVNVSALRELIAACKERVYLFIDNAADRVREIQSLIKGIGVEGRLLTLIAAERTNEWNNNGQALAGFVSDEYGIRYLSMSEIELLLDLLEKHKALGTLTKLTRPEQLEALAEKAGRQLLVALYEATFGIPFEDILVDEFNNIEPFDAQRLYLTVCVLNRLKVPVRAGVIARIHGIPFNDFKARLFLPLEHVVFAELDETTRDYVYRARHPNIADVVFQRILSNTEERFDLYIRCLKALNVAYSADWKAFWQMVKGRLVLEMFPDHRMVVDIYRVAKAAVGEDEPHLLHQMALYEMHRPNGNHQEANRLLARAAQLAPYDVAIKHSSAEFKLRSVDEGQSRLERSKSLKDAGAILRTLVANDNESPHAHHTLVKVGIRTLRETLANGDADESVAKRIKEVEDQLFSASQLFPGDSYLAEAEAELAKVLHDDERARKSMAKAFETNPRNGFIALRLAQIHQEEGDLAKAKLVLRKGLEANNADKRLHFAYGKLLMDSQTNVGDELLYHFQRSYTRGDSNYDAQLLYGRELFVTGDVAASRLVFEGLSKVRVSPQLRNRLHYKIVDKRFSGKIWKVETNYALIIRDGFGDVIFLHNSKVPMSMWKEIVPGDTITFAIAFTFRGPSGFAVRIAGSNATEPSQLDLLPPEDPE
jgi:tetratricopeptide (TPR) repeat protein